MAAGTTRRPLQRCEATEVAVPPSVSQAPSGSPSLSQRSPVSRCETTHQHRAGLAAGLAARTISPGDCHKQCSTKCVLGRETFALWALLFQATQDTNVLSAMSAASCSFAAAS